MSFSAEGDKLASVSMAPDYMLTIWDWEDEQMGLHSKAFGQDVWNVQFSLDDPRRLTTSGIGHIRFWKMAATFTGLKLQGSIGKFGKIDLSDIEHFVELPDGKVVSGTESGSLLLWEGNFIKCRFVQVGGEQCHGAPITYLGYDREEKCIISGSLDGKIRWWDFNAIDTAEVDSDQTMDFELLPLTEFSIGQGVGIKTLLDTGAMDYNRSFIVIDTNGRAQTIRFALLPRDESGNQIYGDQMRLCDVILSMQEQSQKQKLQVESLQDSETNDELVVDENQQFAVERNTFSQFHSGGITGMDTCPSDHLVATCGSDGAVRCIDYVNRKEVTCRIFQNSATTLKWLGPDIDPTGKSVIVGFSDGTVRVLSLGFNLDRTIGWVRRMVFKPHNMAVVDISFSDSGKYVATSGKDGIIFFQKCSPLREEKLVTWDPLRFVTISSFSGNKTSSIFCERTSWSPNEKYILASCSDGVVREVDLTPVFAATPLSAKPVAESKQFDEGGNELPSNNGEEEEFTFEISLSGRDIQPQVQVLTSSKSGVLTIVQPSNSSGGDNSEAVTPPPESPTKTRGGAADNNIDQPVKLAMKVNQAIYALNRNSTFVASASLSITQHVLCESDLYDNSITKELTNGVHSAEGKDSLKNPLVTTMRYGWTKRYLLVGASDGTAILRPSEYLEVFCRASASNGSTHGVGSIATSFDDRFLFSAGKDGCLVVHRVRLDLLSQRVYPLYKDLDAGVYGSDPVKPKAKTVEAEPSYLSYVSSYNLSVEDGLFAPKLTDKKEANILEQQLYDPIEEYVDLGPNSYSIQDNRLKAEEDARKIAAGDLKSRIRASVKTLRKDYEKIVKENESIPDKVRLTTQEMTVDQDYFDTLKQLGNEMLEEVHRECAYDAEKSEKLLYKIKSRLMQGLLIEEMPLSAFDTNGFIGPDGKVQQKRLAQSVVYSLRTSALDPAVIKVINQVKAQVRQQELIDSQQRANDLAQKKAMDAMEDMKQRLQQKKDDTTGDVGKLEGTSGLLGGHEANVSGVLGGSTTLNATATGKNDSASAALIRRMKRKERKEEISRHELQKPNENDDDVRDIQAIKHAEKTMGDYKLKCSDDYEVPEDQRINANKKLRQMAMLEDSMLTMRLQFNERFLMLRQLKQQLIYSIRRNNQRIREVDQELNQASLSQQLWEPKLKADEFPEDYEEVTEEELIEYMNQSSNWEKSKAPQHRVIIGNKLEVLRNKKTGAFEVVRRLKEIESVSQYRSELDGFLSDASLIGFTPERSEPLKYYEVKECLLSLPPASTTAFIATTPATPSAASRTPIVAYEVSMEELNKIQTLEEKIPILKFTKSLLKERMQTSTPSAVQEKLNQQRRQQLQFERQMILKSMEDNIQSFREALDDLRVERHQIIGNLKLAEFKLLTLFQEYQLLQTFEFRDNTLQQKQVRCKSEESEIVALGSENKSKLESKTEEIQHWNEKLTNVTAEFKSLLPDNHPYLETLTKIFKKKIKRSKGGDEENEDEDYEDEDQDDDDEDDDDDDEEVEDICPPGCDQSLFEKILELREKKLDTEEICSEIQKNIDDLKKTGDRLRQREKQISKETQQTEMEVQQFQLQKQAALNQIRVVVPIRLSQMYTFELSGVLTGPTDKPAAADDASVTEKADALKQNNKRELVSSIQMKSHTLFSTK